MTKKGRRKLPSRFRPEYMEEAEDEEWKFLQALEKGQDICVDKSKIFQMTGSDFQAAIINAGSRRKGMIAVFTVYPFTNELCVRHETFTP